MDRPLIKDMTTAELYALDFEKMSAGDLAEFRTELFDKPGHGPMAPANEHRRYAEAHARWSDWVKGHPEDGESPKAAVGIGPAPPSDPVAVPPPNPTPRPDGTAPRARPRETGL